MTSHAPVLTLLGGAAIAGLYFGHLARRIHLPSLIGYMCLGVLLGPSGLDLLGEAVTDRLGFVTEMALGFVAFSIGSELSVASLRRQGVGLVSIICAESFMAFLVTFGAIWLWTGDLALALVFGAMAPASAPAGTVAVIQDYRAKGSLTRALYAVVGFDDGLAIIIFGFAAALAKALLLREATGTAGSLLPTLLGPCREIALSLLVGGAVGLVFCQLVRRAQHHRDILVILFGSVLVTTGLSVQLGLSLILTNMTVGFVLANTRRDALVQRVSDQLLVLMPLIFILFFCLAGAHLKLGALPALGLIGVVYVLARSAGLIGGARLGAMVGAVEEKIKKYLGLAILSQAGVAIGLALIVKQEFARIGTSHAAHIGTMVITVITATSVVFEIVGPILAKVALQKAGEIPSGDERPRPASSAE